MKKIKIKKWRAKVPDGKDEKGQIKYKYVDESTLTALNILIANIKPQNMPRGLDAFRIFNRLSKAFTKAEKTDILELDDVDYKFLKDTIKRDVPSIWGLNPNISEAIEEFLNVEEY